MARYTGPKNRIARRFGANIFGRMRNPCSHKQNPPGQHGARKRKKSEFALQLEEQKKLRACYGMISKGQLVLYYKQAFKSLNETQNAFIQLLETRLDILVYRCRLGATIFHAQQLVSHGHIFVDGKKVNVRSFHVRPGMVISIKDSSKENNVIKGALEKVSTVPEYLSLNTDNMSGQLLSMPNYDQIPLPLIINLSIVCEYLAYTS